MAYDFNLERDHQDLLSYPEMAHSEEVMHGDDATTDDSGDDDGGTTTTTTTTTEDSTDWGNVLSSIFKSGATAASSIYGAKPTTAGGKPATTTGFTVKPPTTPSAGLSTTAWIGIIGGGILVVGLIIFAVMEGNKATPATA